MSNWTLERNAEFLHVYVENAFEPGAKYIAVIEYSGSITSSGVGLYWDSYVSKEDGSTMYVCLMLHKLSIVGRGWYLDSCLSQELGRFTGQIQPSVHTWVGNFKADVKGCVQSSRVPQCEIIIPLSVQIRHFHFMDKL